MNSLLSIQNAVVKFASKLGSVTAVDSVSLEVEQGKTLALVGESGCGKTTLAKAILGLQPLSSGEISLEGRKISEFGSAVIRHLGMVWQDPSASLNPRWTIRRSLEEPFRLAKLPPNIEELMTQVGLDPVLASRYPHELSGGQRQRAAIGRAIALRPSLVLCDEPTAALDLSIRAQILNLLNELQEKLGMSFFYISHDLSTVRYIADRVAVMYLGNIVEEGNAEEIFDSPKHPYTRALLDSAPSLDHLQFLPDPLPGEVPDPRSMVSGCKFHPRCTFAQAKCAEERPPLFDSESRKFACFFPLELAVAPKGEKN